MIRLVIQIGVILVVVVALPYKVFELDRYFVPKELVLHGAALLIAVVLVARRRSLSLDLVDGPISLDLVDGPISFGLVDGLISFFLLWSVASALFATNHWARSFSGERALWPSAAHTGRL